MSPIFSGLCQLTWILLIKILIRLLSNMVYPTIAEAHIVFNTCPICNHNFKLQIKTDKILRIPQTCFPHYPSISLQHHRLLTWVICLTTQTVVRCAAQFVKTSSCPKGSQHAIPQAIHTPHLKCNFDPFYDSFLRGCCSSIKGERMNEINEIQKRRTRTTDAFEGEKIEQGAFIKLYQRALNHSLSHSDASCHIFLISKPWPGVLNQDHLFPSMEIIEVLPGFFLRFKCLIHITCVRSHTGIHSRIVFTLHHVKI